MMANKKNEAETDPEDKLTEQDWWRLRFHFSVEEAHRVTRELELGAREKRGPFAEPFTQQEADEARGVAEAWNKLVDTIERVIGNRAAKAKAGAR